MSAEMNGRTSGRELEIQAKALQQATAAQAFKPAMISGRIGKEKVHIQ
jgi:hypothetical protein